MKKSVTGFIVKDYSISQNGNGMHLFIEGQKLPPPSKRIILHQKNIKVLSAKITYMHKKGPIQFEVTRINRVKSFGEVRLHTNNILYPGIYEIALDFTGELDEESLKNSLG